MREFDFIIIGGGLSGLAAHHELQKKGYKVITLEASPIPGGRVRTEKLGGGFSDTGAQFFTYNYPRINRLITELNLKAHPASSLMGQKEKNKNYVLETKNPLSSFSTGLLSFTSLTVLLTHTMKLKLTLRGVHPEDPVALAKFDDSDARTYCLKHLNQEILDKLFIPYFSAFNYAPPEELSSALVIRALLHIASGKSLMGLEGGLATLPFALAKGKEISFGTKVLSIEGKNVITDKGEFSASHIIVATPARVAQNLLGEKFPKGLNTLMSPSVHEGILVKKKKRDGTYGTLVSPERHADFNVLTNEEMKSPGLAPEDFDLFGILRSRTGAQKEIVSGAEELLGIQGEEIIERRTTVWKEAIPVLSPGHLKQVSEYRKTLSRDSAVLLAGDYLSTGCSEGAVESGEFIASLF